MKTSEMAYKAAEYLSEHGHAKGMYYVMSSGSVCMMGAASAAIGYQSPNELRMYDQGLFQTWTRLFATKTDGLDIATWNDLPETTKEDAVLKLKEIGRMYEEQGD